jgi:acetyl-CoA carboxylase beta subunit
MQMAKVSAALARYRPRGRSVHLRAHQSDDGRRGGQLRRLGDVVFAEPKALIGFAGPRTIQATIRIELPEGLSDQRVPAGTRLYRPDRLAGQTQERDRAHDRLLW